MAEAATIHGNRELISQALANLVENAIKYGQPVAPAVETGSPDKEYLWTKPLIF